MSQQGHGQGQGQPYQNQPPSYLPHQAYPPGNVQMYPQGSALPPGNHAQQPYPQQPHPQQPYPQQSYQQQPYPQQSYPQQNYQQGPPAFGSQPQWAPPQPGHGPPSNQAPQQGHWAPPGQYQSQNASQPFAPYQQQGYNPQVGYGAPPGQSQQQSQWGQHQAGPSFAQPPGQGPPQGGPREPGLSPGYSLSERASAPGTFRPQADALRSTLAAHRPAKNVLIDNLARLGPVQLNDLKAEYPSLSEDIQRHHSGLVKTSNHFWDTLLAISRGPLDQDCAVVQAAIVGLGTDEAAVNDVLLGRSNADIRAITRRYGELFRSKGNLVLELPEEYSGDAKKFFAQIVLAQRNEEWTSIQHQQVTEDVRALHKALHSTITLSGPKPSAVYQDVFANRSYSHIREVARAYEHEHRRSLLHQMTEKLSGGLGDMKHAILTITARTTNLAHQDAELLHKAMDGKGTNHKALIRHIVMVHWDQNRMTNCKQAFSDLYRTSLVQRIKQEKLNDHDYEHLLIACTGAPYQ